MTVKKKISLFAGAIAIVAIGIWVACRWEAWFHNPEEPAYAVAGDAPSRVLLTFGNDGEMSRMVSWMCGDKVDDEAMLLLADSTDTIRAKAVGEVFASRSGKAAYYRAEMKALKPMTRYRYAVVTNGVRSPWYTFRTSDPKSQRFTFLYMGDVQDTINGIANKLLRQAVERHPEVEFVAFGGDLIERPMHKYYEETFRSLDSVCTAMPVINVTGNHDYLKYLVRKCERRFALTFPYFLKGQTERGDENHLFSFTYHNTQFLLLDSDRGMPSLWAQRQWLKERLAASEAEHRIVITHHPLYSVRKKNNNLIQRWMFNDIILDAGTDLVLQGHEHGYTRCTADEAPLQGHECRRPPLYTISHCSPKNYRLHPAERFHPVFSGSRYYQVVSVDAKGITMRGYDANTNRQIDIVRIKKGTPTKST